MDSCGIAIYITIIIDLGLLRQVEMSSPALGGLFLPQIVRISPIAVPVPL